MTEPNPDVVNQLATSENLRRQYRNAIAALAIIDLAVFTCTEAERLRARFGLPVVPLLFRVEDHQLVRLRS